LEFQVESIQQTGRVLRSLSRCTQIPENAFGGQIPHSIRIFRTFGANKKHKPPAISNLHDLSNHTFALIPKSIQVVDRYRLVRSFWVAAAPKVRKNRFEYSVTAEKGAAEAHYALDNLQNKVLAAEYQTVLPNEKLIAKELERSRQQLEERGQVSKAIRGYDV
jgi:hypothetical protein